MKQVRPTCNVRGPGVKCFLLEGHQGKHRSAEVIKWAEPPEARAACPIKPHELREMRNCCDKIAAQLDIWADWIASQPAPTARIPEHELINRLRSVRLRGHGQVEVYRNCSITIEKVEIDSLLPTQTYVLRGTLRVLEGIADRLGDAFLNLRDGLVFNGVPFLPPVVEESQEGLIVNDGMHRLWTARKRSKYCNVVVIRDVPDKYPYYAYPLDNGWDGVREVDVRPNVKKRYRDPENYKDLFRDFNAVFPGVQKQRAPAAPVTRERVLDAVLRGFDAAWNKSDAITDEILKLLEGR